MASMKSALASVPVYFMLLFVIPRNIAQTIEKL